jgi:hypothetical protein
MPEYLQTAVEYRNQLRAELAKVNEFLRFSDRGLDSHKRETPDFLFAGSDEILVALTL